MSEILVSGTVKHLGDEIQVSASFKKKECVVTTDEQYPQHILINFTQDKTEYLDAVSVGDKVKIAVNLRGREWTNPQGEVKYFNDIQGWKVYRHTDENGSTNVNQTTAATAAPAAAPATAAAPTANSFEDDDLPF